MAKLAVTLTALFLFFAVISARTPFDLPENNVIDHDPSSSLPVPEADAKPTLLLPSEKTSAEIDAEDLPESETRTVDALPLTIVTFRPVNRHVPSMRAYPFRIGVRRCRHGMRPMMYPRARGGEVPYGDDMILGGERRDFDPEMFHGGVRQIPARWMRFHHHHHHDHHHGEGMPAFPFDRHHDMFAKQRFGRPFRREEEGEREEEEREEGGFMSRFRKFLNHF
ncbi:Myb-related protein like [Actinidia chinensis var. chinensis]|uniref:Myb-related protein like n=1 Tax=Actinidia chinensis var. chinensis TaxID=1590841 RepID=A0A2R6QN22_ACTCC|nr:Myb-related protein like [Actinidia chinensis var. chinensis]